MNTPRLVKSFLLITLLSLTIIGGSTAFFSDTETSTGNVLGAGTIDLKIDNTSYYNGVLSSLTSWELADLDDNNGPANGKYLFFNFEDLKPGDLGADSISLHVTDNNYWACMDMTLTKNDDVSSVEPELELDTPDDPNDLFDGELAQEINMVWWADDGDSVLEDDEDIIANDTAFNLMNNSLALADSTVNYWTGTAEPLLGSSDPNENVYYVAKAWCFGTLALEPKPQGDYDVTQGVGVVCSGVNTSNISQTDALSVDVSFRAIQSRNNNGYSCLTGLCENTEESYANGIYSEDQGLRKDGSAVLAERSDPNNALGAPNGVFYSLGFGGSLAVSFPTKIYDAAGPDLLSFHEVTNGRNSYPLEQAEVEVSQDGNTWKSIGTVTNQTSNGISYLDFSSTGWSWIQYVKVTDTSNPDLHNNEADGFDINAFDALVCTQEN